MATDAFKAEIGEKLPVELSSWYVGLAQLPGFPLKLRLEALAVIAATLEQLPVSAVRNHCWAGSVRGSTTANEESDDDFDLSEALVADPSGATTAAESGVVG
jgi:hypothetical protein